MIKQTLIFAAIALAAFGFAVSQSIPKIDWPPHDVNRPQPPIVDPGPAGPSASVPADAIVLFDGKSLDGWETAKGAPATWKVEKGYMEIAPKAGSIQTKKGFGDCQLHVEWAAPAEVKGSDQGRGNSGVFLMNIYEVQVLDCYNNKTYADGTTAALYGQHPPLVNACRKPGEWQTYDIVFHRPRFDKDGGLVTPARFTVLFNGILVQDNAVLTGPTVWQARPPYQAHADKLPVGLQDHGNPVRYRNIWIRELS